MRPCAAPRRSAKTLWQVRCGPASSHLFVWSPPALLFFFLATPHTTAVSLLDFPSARELTTSRPCPSPFSWLLGRADSFPELGSGGVQDHGLLERNVREEEEAESAVRCREEAAHVEDNSFYGALETRTRAITPWPRPSCGAKILVEGGVQLGLHGRLGLLRLPSAKVGSTGCLIHMGFGDLRSHEGSLHAKLFILRYALVSCAPPA